MDILDVYWIYSIVDELDVIFVVLRNSAANAAVAAIAAVFLLTEANCVEYMCIQRNYKLFWVTVCPIIASNIVFDANFNRFLYFSYEK